MVYLAVCLEEYRVEFKAVFVVIAFCAIESLSRGPKPGLIVFCTTEFAEKGWIWRFRPF